MTSENDAEVKRLFEKEKWPIGTIAKHFHLHHSTVTRILTGVKAVSAVKPSILDPYKDFIRETLEVYPDLATNRIFGMIQERGYPGTSPTTVANFVNSIRPKTPSEAFLRLRMLPGEQAQVDWGQFGRMNPKDPRSRKLMGFVMTLSYSRMIYLKFFLGESETHFLQGHLDSFEFFGGVPRSVLIDNLKTGVTERLGSHVRFNESYLSFAKHFGFQPKAANVRRGNEKGRVERSIRYIRDSFFSARHIQDLESLNRQAEDWCVMVSAKRKWVDDKQRTVLDAFGDEKLMSLPNERFFVLDRKMARVGKTPYVRYDTNDYSVPAKCVGSHVEIQSCTDWVHIVLNQKRVASHKRSHEKHKTLEHPEHLTEVLACKKRARRHSELHRLTTFYPKLPDFLKLLESKGGTQISKLRQVQKLEVEFGGKLLGRAIEQCLVEERASLSTLKMLLKHYEREANSQSTSQPQVPQIGRTVIQHNPEDYETLTKETIQ